MCLDVQSLRKHMNEYEFEFVLQKNMLYFRKAGDFKYDMTSCDGKRKRTPPDTKLLFCSCCKRPWPPISFNSTSLQSEEFLGLKIWRKRCNKFAVIFIFAVLTTKTFAPKSSTQNFPPTNFQIKLPTSIITSSHGFLGLFYTTFYFLDPTSVVLIIQFPVFCADCTVLRRKTQANQLGQGGQPNQGIDKEAVNEPNGN